MKTNQKRSNWLRLLLFAGAATALLPATSRAQMGMAEPVFPRAGQNGPPPRYGVDGGKDTSKPDKVELPYGGQLYCPVTGIKLGLSQTAIPVQTSIGEEKPGAFSKLFGAKGKPGAVIYVCCKDCVEKVRKEPMRYLGQLISDRADFHFSYANAPPQRPILEKLGPEGRAQELAKEASDSKGMATPPPANPGVAAQP